MIDELRMTIFEVASKSSLEGGGLRSVSAAGRWVFAVGISNIEQGITNDEVRANHD